MNDKSETTASLIDLRIAGNSLEAEDAAAQQKKNRSSNNNNNSNGSAIVQSSSMNDINEGDTGRNWHSYCSTPPFVEESHVFRHVCPLVVTIPRLSVTFFLLGIGSFDFSA